MVPVTSLLTAIERKDVIALNDLIEHDGIPRRISHTRKLSLSGKQGGKSGSWVTRPAMPTGTLRKRGVSFIKCPGRPKRVLGP